MALAFYYDLLVSNNNKPISLFPTGTNKKRSQCNSSEFHSYFSLKLNYRDGLEIKKRIRVDDYIYIFIKLQIFDLN
jgi:hypothetical protein